MSLLLVQTGLDNYTAEELADKLEKHGVHPANIQTGHRYRRTVEVEVTPDSASDVARLMENICRHLESV